MKSLKPEEYQALFSDGEALRDRNVCLSLAERADYTLPRRKARTHKYNYGRALIIAGATGFSGAPVLAANACERSGAGLTTLMIPESIYPIAASRCDGAVVTPLPSDASGHVSRDAVMTVLPALEKANACAIGPGLGAGAGAEAVVAEVLRSARCPLILDADAISICGKKPELFASCHTSLLLTPHEGEFVRLGGDLSSGRLAGALAYSSASENRILILKGYGTLICRGRDITVNPTGSPALAKGGSGDVLCGILCGLLAQGFDELFSARCGVYLHGRAGDIACKKYGEYSVTPGDIISHLPDAFQELPGQRR